MTSRIRTVSLLAASLLALTACGTGTESGPGAGTAEESRNAAISAATPAKPVRVSFARLPENSAVRFDPVSKRTVTWSVVPARDALFTGSVALVDVNEPFDEKVPVTMPIVHGDVFDTVPDGNGGWFLGGNIRGVGTEVFTNPRYIVHLGALGQLLNFEPFLPLIPDVDQPAVTQMWLDPNLGRLVVATKGIQPPRHFLAADGLTSAQTHYYSVRVLDLEGRDVTADHIPAVSAGLRMKTVIDGVAYVEPIDQNEFGFSLDGTKRHYLEALDLRTGVFTGFGSRFYAETCTNRGLCSRTYEVVAAGSGLLTAIPTRQYRLSGEDMVDLAFMKFNSSGVTGSLFGAVTYVASRGNFQGYTVLGNTLYVGVCTPGDRAFVRAYSLTTTLKLASTYQPTETAADCTHRKFIRIGDDLYVSEPGEIAKKITRISPATLQPVSHPFTRTVKDGTGSTVREDFPFSAETILTGGDIAASDVKSQNGRAWFETPNGLNARYLQSNFYVTDENATPLAFNDGLSSLDRHATSNFQVREGKLYALTVSRSLMNEPRLLLRWDLTTLTRDEAWSLEVPDTTQAFAVGDTAVLISHNNAKEKYTAIDLATGFPRFTYTVPVQNNMNDRTMVVEGDVVWTTGQFNSNAGQHAVVRLDMLDGSTRLSGLEPTWCQPANRGCLGWKANELSKILPLVPDGQFLYTAVSGRLIRIDKTTMETVRGPQGNFLGALSSLGIWNGLLHTYDVTARQVVRFALPSMEARGAIGAPLPLSADTMSTSIVSGLTGTSTGVNLVLRHPVALGPTTFGYGLVAMSGNGTLALGLRNAISTASLVTAPPAGPNAVPGENPADVRQVIENEPPSFPPSRVSITRVSAGHRSLSVTFASTALGSPHRVVDQTGKTRCTTSTDTCVLKNLSPSVGLSLSVVPADKPEAASAYSDVIKPSFITKKGVTVKLSSLMKPGKAKATWSVKGGCTLNAARTSLMTPKKRAVCVVRVKGGKGKSAYNLSARVTVN